MPVRQEHGIDLDDIGCHALPGTRDGRRWLEGGNFGQPQLARRGCGFRCAGLFAWDNHRSLARQWDSLGYRDRSGCKQSNCDIKGACPHVPERRDSAASVYQARVGPFRHQRTLGGEFWNRSTVRIRNLHPTDRHSTCGTCKKFHLGPAAAHPPDGFRRRGVSAIRIAAAILAGDRVGGARGGGKLMLRIYLAS